MKELRFKQRKPRDYNNPEKRAQTLLAWTCERPQSKLHKKWAKRTKKEKLAGGCG